MLFGYAVIMPAVAIRLGDHKSTAE